MKKISIPNDELIPEVVKMLSEGSCVTIKAKGDSMLPFIVGGKDSVVLQKKDTFAIGDIVLAEIAPKVFFLHRIIKIDGKQIVMMGDGNVSGVEICCKDKICGHAISIIHKGKQIDCYSTRERRKAKFWIKIVPIRRYLLAIYRRII